MESYQPGGVAGVKDETLEELVLRIQIRDQVCGVSVNAQAGSAGRSALEGNHSGPASEVNVTAVASDTGGELRQVDCAGWEWIVGCQGKRKLRVLRRFDYDANADMILEKLTVFGELEPAPKTRSWGATHISSSLTQNLCEFQTDFMRLRRATMDENGQDLKRW
jgi:hypothetical protein